MIRRVLCCLLTALCGLTVAYARPVAEFYDKHEYNIPMRDGVHLYTAVYTPKSGDVAPILIFRTPYGCGPYGVGEFSPDLEGGYLRCYLDRGYIVVEQDVRGRYMSEGTYVNIRPVSVDGGVDETTDSYDTVEWLLEHVAGHNGRVGFAGCSYLGFYAMLGGLSGHPAVKAVSPQAPVVDWFMGDDVHHNGVLMLTDSYGFLSGMSHAGTHEPAARMPAKQSPSRTPDEYAFFLGRATLDSLTRLMAPTPFWEEIAAHPDYDAWWQVRDVRRVCRNVKPAVLVVGGTFDAEDCFGAWNLYKAIREQSPATDCRLVVGPWAHGAWCGGDGRLGDFDFGEQAGWYYYMEHFELPFFARHLWGGVDAAELPAVSVFVSGRDRWQTFDRWPPRRATEQNFYLRSEGGFSTAKPSLKGDYSEYLSDPANPVPYNQPLGTRRDRNYMVADQRFVEGRSDVLTFVSEPLPEEMTWVGEVTASLETAISTTDADFVVKVIDCYPDKSQRLGYRMLVRGDVMRGRYRNSFSQPEPFVPEQVENVSFCMPDIAHTFRAGHRVMIQVHSSWFPLAERSPQQFVDLWHCAASDFIPSRIRIYHNHNHASAIRVRVLEE